MKTITCRAPVNIATIKYWGKRDESFILPLNDSLSVTLSMDNMCATTTVSASPDFKRNRMWLNGKEESFENPRLQACLNDTLERARLQHDGQGDGLYDWNVHICSENNFPTAAGLASSAAGYACLVYALAKLYDIKGDLTELARRGSGSACRSIYGGFVRWNMGIEHDGSDSIATQVAPASHWTQLRALILIVDWKQKKVSSRSGMKTSVETSQLLQHRVKHCVPERIKACEAAISSRDFSKFAEVTMQDSNQFHAVCLDTYPPCVYMNDVSHAIVSIVHMLNEASGETIVAYTFDAGPNATLFLLEQHVPLVLAVINYFFPRRMTGLDRYLKGDPVEAIAVPHELIHSFKTPPYPPGQLQFIIHSKVGEGPEVLDESHQLLDCSGLPISLKS